MQSVTLAYPYYPYGMGSSLSEALNRSKPVPLSIKTNPTLGLSGRGLTGALPGLLLLFRHE